MLLALSCCDHQNHTRVSKSGTGLGKAAKEMECMGQNMGSSIGFLRKMELNRP